MDKKSKYDDLYEELLELGHEEKEANTFVLWKMGYDKGFDAGGLKGTVKGIIITTLIYVLVELLLGVL